MAANKSTETATKRTRNYASVVYPDSAPQDWQSILADQFIPAFVSPLHDQDLDPGDHAKKPHYHVLLCYEGPKTKDQAVEIFDKIGGVGCEVVNSLRGYARYLCHLDNPEKHQYDPSQVRSFSGSDYTSVIGLPTDKYKAIKEMIQFCKDHNIDAYCDLLEYASDNRDDWFVVLCDNGTYVVKEHLRSKTWKMSRQTLRGDIDPQTGEYL